MAVRNDPISQKWLYERTRFLKIFKFLAFSLFVKDNRKGPVLRQSGLNFQTLIFFPRPPCGRPREGTQYFSGGGAPKKGLVFFVFHSWDLSKKRPVSRQTWPDF